MHQHQAVDDDDVEIEYLHEVHATLKENLPNGTTVGYLSVRDEDSFERYDNHTYAVVEGSNNWAIGGEGGDELIAMFEPNFEVQSKYSVKIKATDTTNGTYSGNTIVEDFVIAIIDVNDVAPHSIQLSPSSVEEGNALQNGLSMVGKVTWEDPDTTNAFEFFLGGDDQEFFEFQATPQLRSGYLYAKESFDYEERHKYSLTLTIDDGGQSEPVSQLLTIAINNKNDEAPSECSMDGTSISENAAGVVGSFSYSDPDPHGEDDTISLTDASGLFSFRDNMLYLDHGVDYEAGNISFPITLTVDDGVNAKLKCEYIIQITDLNDNKPEEMSLYPGDNSKNGDGEIELVTVTVAEDSKIGTVVATLSYTDKDKNAAESPEQEFSVSFTQSSFDTEYFAISQSLPTIYNDFEGHFTLVTKKEINFENEGEQSFGFTLELDDGDPEHILYQNVKVQVTDVNDNAPQEVFLDNSLIKENVAVGTVVGNLSFVDLDSLGAYTVSIIDPESVDEEQQEYMGSDEEYMGDGIDNEYMTDVVDADDEGASDQNGEYMEDTDAASLEAAGVDKAYFELEKISDKLYAVKTAKRLLNVEEQAEYWLSFSVSDGKHTVVDTVEVSISDSNNNPPTDLELVCVQGECVVDEDTKGAKVGTLSFSDIDSDSENEFSFTLVNKEPSDDVDRFDVGAFDKVGAHTHQASLTTKEELDFETHETYTISVTVSDGVYEIERDFTISTKDLNDNKPTNIVLTQNSVIGNPTTYPNNLGSRTIGTYPENCDGSTGTEEGGASPCVLIYIDEDGNDVSLWSVDADNDDSEGRYEGWLPLCPSKIAFHAQSGSRDCFEPKGEDADDFINPEHVVVYDAIPYCGDSEYVEFFAAGKNNQDYVEDEEECKHKL